MYVVFTIFTIDLNYFGEMLAFFNVLNLKKKMELEREWPNGFPAVRLKHAKGEE